MFKPVLKSTGEDVHFLRYEPRTFDAPVPDQAVPMARTHEIDEVTPPFVISDLVAETTKLTELEKKNFQARVQGEVLAHLKTIEEKAYGEAHSLGLKEGQDKGFTEMQAEVQKQIESLRGILEEITNLKSKLLISNEKHIVETIFHVAQAIALDQIQANPENIVNVVGKALENAQGEEEVTIRLNPSDLAFFEKHKGAVGSPFEKIARLRIEAAETVNAGGAIIDTNYGIVDASIEQRVRKVREALMSKVPKS